jgi:uroporphyrinogen-III synthase
MFVVGHKTREVVEERVGKVAIVGNSMKELVGMMEEIKGFQQNTYFYFWGDKVLDDVPDNFIKIQSYVNDTNDAILEDMPKDWRPNIVVFYAPSGWEVFTNAYKQISDDLEVTIKLSFRASKSLVLVTWAAKDLGKTTEKKVIELWGRCDFTWEQPTEEEVLKGIKLLVTPEGE